MSPPTSAIEILPSCPWSPPALPPSADTEDGALPLPPPGDQLDQRLEDLPLVQLRRDEVPPALSPETFFATMISRVLDNCPINFHEEARHRRTHPTAVAEDDDR